VLSFHQRIVYLDGSGVCAPPILCALIRAGVKWVLADIAAHLYPNVGVKGIVDSWVRLKP